MQTPAFHLTAEQAIHLFNCTPGIRQLEIEVALNCHDFNNRPVIGVMFSLSDHGRRHWHAKWHAEKVQHMAARGWPEYQRAIRDAGLVREAA